MHRVELEAVEKDPHPVKHLKLRSFAAQSELCLSGGRVCGLLELGRLSSEHNLDRRWDAAAKRPFSNLERKKFGECRVGHVTWKLGLAKMLAFMEQKSEAGVAKRSGCRLSRLSRSAL